MDTIRRLFLVARPISWPNTAYPFAAGYLVSGGTFDVLFIVATLYFLGPYNLLMYGVNDVFDYESDIRNPRKGGIEGMKEQRSFHPTVMKAAILTNVPFLILLILLINPLSSLVLAGLVFFVVAYSVPRLRFKEKPIVDSVTSSIHFVGPLLFALTLTQFTSISWLYILAFFLWGIASHAFGAVQDIIPDRQGGLASVATFFGAKVTMRLAIVFYATAALIVALQPLPYALVGVAGFAYVGNILGYISLSDKESSKANRPWRHFIWINLFVGFVITMVLLSAYIDLV